MQIRGYLLTRVFGMIDYNHTSEKGGKKADMASYSQEEQKAWSGIHREKPK